MGEGDAKEWADKAIGPIQGRQEGRSGASVVPKQAEEVGSKMEGRQASDYRCLETEWREMSRNQSREREWGSNLVQR